MKEENMGIVKIRSGCGHLAHGQMVEIEDISAPCCRCEARCKAESRLILVAEIAALEWAARLIEKEYSCDECWDLCCGDDPDNACGCHEVESKIRAEIERRKKGASE